MVEETVVLLVESTIALAFTVIFGSFYLWLTSDVVHDLLVEKQMKGSRVAALILRHAYRGTGSAYKVPDEFLVK